MFVAAATLVNDVILKIDQVTGLCDGAKFIASPNFDEREHHQGPQAIIIHCISLPPGEYGGDAITDLFCNVLSPKAHPYFADIAHLKVSSHFLIRRCGDLIQYVRTTQRAWHAGESICLGKPKVNDFSIGIELEGLDTDSEGYTDAQYNQLRQLVAALQQTYTELSPQNIFAHSDIAPGRKTDPGPYFDWTRVVSVSE